MPSLNFREYYYINIWLAIEFLYAQGIVTNASESVHKQIKEKLNFKKDYVRYEKVKSK